MDPLVDAVFISTVNLGKTCIQVYDSQTGSCLKSFRGVCVAPNTLCPVGPSDFFLCGQKDKNLLQAWAINQNETLQMRLTIPGRLNVMAVSQAEDKYCALGIAERIHLYHLNSGCRLATISRHYQNVTCLEFTSSGSHLASAGEDGFVYVWSMLAIEESLHKSDRPPIHPHHVLGQHSDKVTGVRICGSGLRGILITCSLDHSAKVFDLVTGQLRYTVIGTCGFTACEANSIGSQLFLAGENGRIWGLNLLPHHATLDIQLEGKGVECHKSRIHHMSLTSAGDTLVTGGADGEVKVWAVVMVERKRAYGAPSLALQKTLLMGRGLVTNIVIWKVDPEIFNVSKLQSSVVVAPFTENVDIIDASFLHPVRRKSKEPIQSAQMVQLAAQLLNPHSQKSDIIKKSTVPNDRSVSDPDFLAYVQKLKKSNKDLYKFCLNHLMEAQK